MLKQISATFGSEELLTKIMAQNTDRNFRLLQATPQDNQLQLIDISGKPSIFKTPINYRLLGHIGNDEFTGLFHFEFLKLDNDNQKIWYAAVNHNILTSILPSGMLAAYLCENKVRTNESLLLTIWRTSSSLDQWIKSKSYQKINLFNDSQNHFYQQNYSIVQ
ncbi:hypothetical protein [Paucilactobacillus kaifaensis]|uniref:hypothetical protein n=1 Tax=Paucilactobacillus kaifaensis TaxID=2559921 RepID=UPI0010F4B256|nr:hypothetical protein [Paucilactobacillus kaifaensis]